MKKKQEMKRSKAMKKPLTKRSEAVDEEIPRVQSLKLPDKIRIQNMNNIIRHLQKPKKK